MQCYNEIWDAFTGDGNIVIGPRPARYIGSFDISWQGGGSVISLEEDITFSTVKLAFINGGGNISIKNGATIKGRLEVSGGGSICIGNSTFINRACDIRGGEGAQVTIGNNCLLSNVKIMTSDMHSVIDLATGKRTNLAQGIAIEDEVWLAEDVKITKGVRIGFGSLVAAGSLVTKNVSPFSIAGGRPAKTLRTGVSWQRKLIKHKALPAPRFEATDITMEKEALRLLTKRKEYALVESVITQSEVTPLPLYARWYLIFSRHQLGHPHPDAKTMLDEILIENPNHVAAKALREAIESSG